MGHGGIKPNIYVYLDWVCLLSICCEVETEIHTFKQVLRH